MKNKAFPTNTQMLNLEFNLLTMDTAGKVVLVRKDNSRNWYLFVEGELVQELRNARAMSLLDGWKLHSAFLKGSQALKNLTSET